MSPGVPETVRHLPRSQWINALMSVSKYCSSSLTVLAEGRQAVGPEAGTFPPGRHSEPVQKYQPITRFEDTRSQTEASFVPGAGGSSTEAVNKRAVEAEMSCGTYAPAVVSKTHH